MGKRALSILLVAAVVLSLGITWTAAEGNAEGWHYENGVLILKDYCGDFNEDLIGEDLIVVVEGEVTMTSTVSGKNVLLVVLPGSDLTISAETGGCVKADNALLLTGDSGTLEMESKDPATPAVVSGTMYTAGAGDVSVSSQAPVGVQADTVVLQQDGQVEITAAETALTGDLIQPADQYTENAPQSPEQEKPGALTSQKKVFVSVEGDNITVVAPQTRALTDHAMLACYEKDTHRLLAVVPGERVDNIWTFDNPGVSGTWKLFFMDDSYSPETKAYDLEMDSSASQVSTDLQLLQLFSAEEEAAQVDYTARELAIQSVLKLGIMSGRADGGFASEGSVTRAEAATVMARMKNGNANFDGYVPDGTLTDVLAEKWYAPYVTYCQKAGIISHMIEDSRFAPDAQVTNMDLAIMLMSVLGYDSRGMGYYGTKGAAKTARKDAEALGLLYNISDPDAAATRGETAQMIWNALQSDVVVGTLSLNAIAQTLPSQADDIDAAFMAQMRSVLHNFEKHRRDKDCNLVLLSDIPMLNALHGLNLVESETDEWGRPGVVWKLVNNGGKTVHWVKLLDEPYQQYIAGANLETVLAPQITDGGYAVSMYLNGNRTITEQVLTSDLLAEIQTHMGNGVLTEVYLDGTSKSIVIVVVDLYIAQITAVSVDGKTCTLSMLDGTEVGTVVNTDKWTIGQWIQFHVCGDELQPVCTAEPVSGTVTGVNSNGFTLDGTDYRYSKNFGEYIDADAAKITAKELGTEVQVLADRYGYVYYVIRPVVETKTVLFVADSAYKELNTDGVYVYGAEQVAFENNAAPETVMIDEKLYASLVSANSDLLATVTVNEPISVMETAEKGSAASYTLQKTGRIVESDSGNALLYGTTNTTQYLLRVKNVLTGKIEYKFFNGKNEVDSEYVLTDLCFFVEDGAYFSYIYANAVYPETNKLTYFIGETEMSSIYLTDGNKVVGYDTYTALVNGEEAIIATEHRIDIDTTNVYCMKLIRIGESVSDQKPVYFDALETSEAEKSVFDIQGDTIVWVGGNPIHDFAEETALYMIEDNSGKISVMKVEDFSDVVDYASAHGWSNSVAYIAYNSEGVVCEMYLYFSD